MMIPLLHGAGAVGMVLLPFAGWFVLSRVQRGLSWRVFAGGVACFIASQVVHIPLNLGVAQAFSSGLVPSPPGSVTPWLVPVALGLSAGLCEELARLGFFRLPRSIVDRDWGPGHAVLFGLGHGGVEAMILGVLSMLGLVNVLALRDPAMLAQVPAEQQAALAAQLDTYWSMPAWQALLGLGERVLTLPIHVACSVLVARGVVGRSPLFVILAILFHAALDAGAVAIAPRGAMLAEGWVAVNTAVAVAVIVWGWSSWPKRADSPPLAPHDPGSIRPNFPADQSVNL